MHTARPLVQHHGHPPATLPLAEDALIPDVLVLVIIALVGQVVLGTRHRSAAAAQPHLSGGLTYS